MATLFTNQAATGRAFMVAGFTGLFISIVCFALINGNSDTPVPGLLEAAALLLPAGMVWYGYRLDTTAQQAAKQRKTEQLKEAWKKELN